MRGEGKSMELLPRKPIINQVEKTQFDYDIVAATVSAYSDRVFSRPFIIIIIYIIIYIYMCFQKIKKKTLKILFCKFIKKKKKRECDSDVVSAVVTSITCLFLIVFFLQMEHLGIIILPKKKKTLLIIPTF
jgi:hypothetical protein